MEALPHVFDSLGWLTDTGYKWCIVSWQDNPSRWQDKCGKQLFIVDFQPNGKSALHLIYTALWLRQRREISLTFVLKKSIGQKFKQNSKREKNKGKWLISKSTLSRSEYKIIFHILTDPQLQREHLIFRKKTKKKGYLERNTRNRFAFSLSLSRPLFRMIIFFTSFMKIFWTDANHW